MPVDFRNPESKQLSLFGSKSDNFYTIPKQCIILDLDENLVHSNEDIDKLYELDILENPSLLDVRNHLFHVVLNDVVSRKGSGKRSECWGIKRPYLDEFLTYCFNRFQIVAIWSAGKQDYVTQIVYEIFKDIKMPHVTFTYDECREYQDILDKPILDMISSNNIISKYMNIKNTFIIDDRLSSFNFCNLKNGIQTPVYEPEFTIDGIMKNDTALLELMKWLDLPKVVNSRDIRTLAKNKIFTEQIDVSR